MTDPRVLVKTAVLAGPLLAGLAALLLRAHLAHPPPPPEPERPRPDRDPLAESLAGEARLFQGAFLQRFGDRWGLRAPDRPPSIRTFATDAEFQRFVAATTSQHRQLPHNGGIFNPARRGEIALSPDCFDMVRAVRHESIHALLHASGAATLIRPLPRWLDEGLASAFEAAPNQEWAPGASPAERRAALAAGPVLLDDLRRLDSADFTSEGNDRAYDASRLWVLFLLAEIPEQFDRFVRQCLQGDDPDAAFRDAFAGAADGLDARYERYLNGE